MFGDRYREGDDIPTSVLDELEYVDQVNSRDFSVFFCAYRNMLSRRRSCSPPSSLLFCFVLFDTIV